VHASDAAASTAITSVEKGRQSIGDVLSTAAPG
jgi:hypothetical protein